MISIRLQTVYGVHICLPKKHNDQKFVILDLSEIKYIIFILSTLERKCTTSGELSCMVTVLIYVLPVMYYKGNSAPNINYTESDYEESIEKKKKKK